MKTNFKYLFISLFSFWAISASAQGKKQQAPEKTRILFLLDASGSMLAPWENSIRMDIAKKRLSELVDSLKVNQQLELALRVYGHQFPSRVQNCQDTKLEIPFGQKNHDAMVKKLATIKPQGTTPIAISLEKAAGDFPTDPTYRNIIILITDGIESCGGDPCAISLALQKKGIFLRPYVIGLGMDKQYEEQFSCLGQFFDASDEKGFRKALNIALTQTLSPTTVSVELLDSQSKRTEKDVNVSFINSTTGQVMYDFVHYRYPNNSPDSISIEPVVTYDMMVHTLPPVFRKNVNITSGMHNTLEVKAPQGWLEVSMANYTDYRKGLQIAIRNAGSNEIIHLHQAPHQLKLLEGTYDVEVFSLPRRTLKNVKVEGGKVNKLPIEAPGIVNINATVNGIGSLYMLDENGKPIWIHNLDENIRLQTLAMQPGNYKIVFRAHLAKGSKYTDVQNFSVKSGATVNIKLF